MTRNLLWAYFAMLFGLAVVVVSVTMDVNGGSDWWHAGTVVGTALFMFGLLTGIWDRRRRQEAGSDSDAEA